MKAISVVILLGLAAWSATKAHAETKPGAYVSSKGVRVYYEVHGTGEPLVLLHGGFGAIEMWGANLDALAAHHRVVAIDLQGHGRTELGARKLSFDAMADDVVAVLDALKIPQADVMGYSLGGTVAMVTAIRHHERVRRLVVVSAPYKRDGWHKEMTDGMSQIGPAAAEPMKKMPMYPMYTQLAPQPGDWPKLVAAMGELLRTPYDYSADVKKLPPTLLVCGDADGVKLAHEVEFFALLGGGLHDAGWDGKARPASQLAVLPGQTHYAIFMAPAVVAAADEFLDSK